MKTRLRGISFVAALFALATAPVAALAHELHVYQIAGKEYVFTVGFLNEPVAVDDSAGVDLAVSLVGTTGGGADHHNADPDAGGTPVTGLEKTLKVEVSAGDVKKVMDLKPTRATPGSYEAAFHPSVQTTYNFRIFGTVNSIPVDVTFSCNSNGTAADDTTEKTLSPNVTQMSRVGGFGCPVSKAESTFPQVSTTFSELNQKVQDIETEYRAMSSTAAFTDSKAFAGMVLGVIGIVLGGVALFRRSRMIQ